MTGNGSAEYIFLGDQAGEILDMMAVAAAYLAGPGLVGFVAWLDQQYPAGVSDPEVLRVNLSRLSGAIKTQLEA